MSDTKWNELSIVEQARNLVANDLAGDLLAGWLEPLLAEVDRLTAEQDRLRDGIEELRERIIKGANQLDIMAEELPHTTDNVRPHVRLLAKAEGLRVALDYTRALDR